MKIKRSTVRVTATRSPTAAYRNYLALRGSPVTSDEECAEHGGWIMVASILHHAASIPGIDCTALVDKAAAIAKELLGEAAVQRGCALDPPRVNGEASQMDIFRMIAERIEDGGLLELAETVVEDLGAACEPDALDEGRILAQRARLAWKSGQLEFAQDRYEWLEQQADRIDSAELRVRAWIGYETLARLKGNYPDVRLWGDRALALADEKGLTLLSAAARRTLMIAAGTGGDYDECLVHGWVLFRLANGRPAEEADALIAIGQSLLEAGHPDAARSAFCAVLTRNPPLRLALPAAGGLALASAKLGHADVVQSLAEKLTDAARRSGHPYETAEALCECGAALSMIGEHEPAARLVAEALSLATTNGYHEIVFRAEHAEEECARRRLVRVHSLGQQASVVVSDVTELDPGSLPEHLSFALR